MENMLILFCLCVFLVELMVFYTPLYVISYKIFRFDKQINDSKLVLILILGTIICAIVCFPFFYNLIRGLII